MNRARYGGRAHGAAPAVVRAGSLAAALCALLWGCVWELRNPHDPYRCDPRCGPGERCQEGRCRAGEPDAGVEPDLADVGPPDSAPPARWSCPRAGGTTAAGRVRFHSALRLERSGLLADLDADGYTDWVTTTGMELFLSPLAAPGTCVFHKDMRWPDPTPDPADAAIERLIVDRAGKTYVTCCAALYGRHQSTTTRPLGPVTDILRCYGYKPAQKAMSWGGTFDDYTAATADLVSGDFDGDGIDVRVVYEPVTGKVTLRWHIQHPGFTLGWLQSRQLPGRQLRAANLLRDAPGVLADELALLEPVSGALHVLRTRTLRSGVVEFELAHKLQLPQALATEELTCANLLGDELQQLVLHDTESGKNRVFAVDETGGTLRALPAVAATLPVRPLTRLRWVRAARYPAEPGGTARNDALLVALDESEAHIYHARHRAGACTYELTGAVPPPVAPLGGCPQ